VAKPPETAAFLRTVPLFRAFGECELADIAARLRERTLRRGQVLFREGDPGAEMFVVRAGTFVVSKAVTGRVEQILARVGPGDFLGEMSLVDRAPRSATVQAETDATVLVLDGESLSALIEFNPRAAAAFFQALVRAFVARLRESGNLVAEVTRWGLEATGLDLEAR